MRLSALDIAIVLASIVLSFLPALFYYRRAMRTQRVLHFRRAAPWWLVACRWLQRPHTDTPNFVTNLAASGGSRTTGAGGRFLLTGMTTVFFFARLWRRSGVLTDLDFYSCAQRQAAHVRARFRAIYLGLFFNCVIWRR